jgi:hypothetical protein
MTKYLLIKIEPGKFIKLRYTQQENGEWRSTMASETMQDIEQFYPDVVELIQEEESK